MSIVIAQMFAPWIVRALQEAAETPETTPTARKLAIEKATLLAKQQHPSLFKPKEYK